jgi:hypothetical protein
MMTDRITPKSWAEFVSELYADDWDDKLNRHRSFRKPLAARFHAPVALDKASRNDATRPA